MKIIIPMTGHGSRFKAAGYDQLKPFIDVQGHPMIEWVVKMFPGDEDEIIFICRKEHLESLDYMNAELKRIAPNAQIFAIEQWEKKGPAYDILLAESLIADDEPVMISYCDYYMHWDYPAFKKAVVQNQCDGALPCYSGFHPNLIPEKNLYATCKVDALENLIEIKEKFSWEADKQKSRHSPGVFYFKTGAFLKKACRDLIAADDHINGEYYMSLPYNYLVKDGLKVWCPINIPYFCQWGTPEDLEEYLFWTDVIENSEAKQ